MNLFDRKAFSFQDVISRNESFTNVRCDFLTVIKLKRDYKWMTNNNTKCCTKIKRKKKRKKKHTNEYVTCHKSYFSDIKIPVTFIVVYFMIFLPLRFSFSFFLPPKFKYEITRRKNSCKQRNEKEKNEKNRQMIEMQATNDLPRGFMRNEKQWRLWMWMATKPK